MFLAGHMSKIMPVFFSFFNMLTRIRELTYYVPAIVFLKSDENTTITVQHLGQILSKQLI